ncbi:MAG TPA: sulfite exporter TauE/SafE family protein [Terriglobia bacterium]|nr:sulfite exporter TauE/SafE family protein [Terriglobia bacterium]
MNLKASMLGFGVGFLVGLTGMGGGAVMTPALILLGWSRPIVAVGTDLAWAAITRTVGAWVYYRQRTVDFTIVRRLALGSVPGALAGVTALAYVHRIRGAAVVDRLVLRMLGIVLICVSVMLLVRSLRRQRARFAPDVLNSGRQALLTTILGAVLGALVGMTAVGSGSLIVACLMVLYPKLSLSRIVGSDIFHALFLLSVAALGHLGLGSIDLALLIGLSIGSIPGVWLGSHLSAILPEKVSRPVLATTLVFLGYKLL